MPTHLAVAIAAENTTSALAQADSVSGVASLVEYRLDLMGDFNLEHLLEHSSLPAIITCRPRRQGGRFVGPEQERLDILNRAVALGAPFVDVESDTLTSIHRSRSSPTQLIGSHHDFEGMSGDWASTGMLIRSQGADVVKLVGNGKMIEDVLPPLVWLSQLNHPGIGITMGEAGAITRILAPRFAQAFLSFAALGEGTAPGQIEALTLAQDFGFTHLAEADPLVVILTPTIIPWQTVRGYRTVLAKHPHLGDQNIFLLPLPVDECTPSVLFALQLARTTMLLALPDLTRAPALAPAGIKPQQHGWKYIGGEWIAVFDSFPEPEQLALSLTRTSQNQSKNRQDVFSQ